MSFPFRSMRSESRPGTTEPCPERRVRDVRARYRAALRGQGDRHRRVVNSKRSHVVRVDLDFVQARFDHELLIPDGRIANDLEWSE